MTSTCVGFTLSYLLEVNLDFGDGNIGREYYSSDFLGSEGKRTVKFKCLLRFVVRNVYQNLFISFSRNV